ncbi:MAG: hypothetical protein OSB73_09870 [Candidatus Latescibacteria bacterium]|nr:hypothetical protein [Candidatus Latescibacterota bacterium]
MIRYLTLPLLFACSWLQAADALIIYRIGGANLPAPALDAPYEFVQLDWADTDPNLHGTLDQLAVDNGSVAPLQLDPDVNLTPLIDNELGGQIRILQWAGWKMRETEDVAAFDGNPETAYLGDGHYVRVSGLGPQNKIWLFDLGGRFLLDRIRIFPRDKFKTHRFIEKFLIGINDGDPLKDGTRDYRLQFAEFDADIIHDISENTQPDLELAIPPVPVRFLLFEGPENSRGIWEIAEFEIYGAGPAPFAGYVSNVIDLGAPASIGEFTWGGSKDPEANIDFRMRAGDDDDPNNYWRFTFRGDERSHFGRDGKALNLRSYGGLESGEKAGVTHDTEHWGFWTTAFGFDVGRADIAASKPRQFIQARADFESTDVASGQLDYLQFAVSIPPVASATLAEISPMVAPAGEATAFSYKVKPRLQPGDLGFDSISIDTPARVLGVDAVRIGGIDAAFTVVELAEVGFTVRIPAVDTQLTEELIEVDFRGEVFKFGTVFTGRVFNSEMPHEVHQSLTPGDADPLVDSDRLQVDLLDLDHSTIQALRLSSRVLTPNGDGVNDRIEIEYDLLNLSGGVPVRVEIYDLAGRSLGRVLQSTADSGRAVMQWSGRAGNGSVLVPGMYILRFEVEADSGVDVIERVVTIAH